MLDKETAKGVRHKAQGKKGGAEITERYKVHSIMKRDQRSGVRDQLKLKKGALMKSYRDLKVWQKAMDLVVECYEETKEFPKSEIFGLTSQLRRAGVSVPANIAEGHARHYTAEFLRHLSIAYGSLAELETHILIAERLNYFDTDISSRMLEETSEVGRMINGLRKSLMKKNNA